MNEYGSRDRVTGLGLVAVWAGVRQTSTLWFTLHTQVRRFRYNAGDHLPANSCFAWCTHAWCTPHAGHVPHGLITPLRIRCKRYLLIRPYSCPSGEGQEATVRSQEDQMEDGL